MMMWGAGSGKTNPPKRPQTSCKKEGLGEEKRGKDGRGKKGLPACLMPMSEAGGKPEGSLPFRSA